MSEQAFSVLVRYREKGGILKFEVLRGTKAEIEDTLLNYLSSKDAHSLMILGQSSIDQELRDMVEVCLSAIKTNLSAIESNQQDLGYLEHDFIHKPRPYPYDVTVNLTATAGAGANVFGAYVQLIPRYTFDFGDENNRIQVVNVCICAMSANGAYLLEFCKFIKGVYVVLGAIRVTRSAPQTRSFFIRHPCRPLSMDETALYCRLKSSVAGVTMTFSLHVARFIPTTSKVKTSTGVFPFA